MTPSADAPYKNHRCEAAGRAVWAWKAGPSPAARVRDDTDAGVACVVRGIASNRSIELGCRWGQVGISGRRPQRIGFNPGPRVNTAPSRVIDTDPIPKPEQCRALVSKRHRSRMFDAHPASASSRPKHALQPLRRADCEAGLSDMTVCCAAGLGVIRQTRIARVHTGMDSTL
jgi:hypothetical protein